MQIVDIIIILMIILGAVVGFKEGFIKKTTSFLGTFLVIVVAYSLKNPVSVLMYENLPFFEFGGIIKGIGVINILVYELLAFLIVAAALMFVLRILIGLTGIVEKLLKMTIFLSIPSKILGIFVGALEYYVYIFLILVFLNLPAFNITIVKESSYADKILHNTPVLSDMVGTTVDTYTEVYNIMHDKNNMTNTEVNQKVLELFLEKKVITVDSAQKLLTFIYKFPDVVKSAALKKTPHILANYSYELSSLFHNFYETNKIITENDEQTKENICLIKAVKITLFNALNLIGVVPEERM